MKELYSGSGDFPGYKEINRFFSYEPFQNIVLDIVEALNPCLVYNAIQGDPENNSVIPEILIYFLIRNTKLEHASIHRVEKKLKIEQRDYLPEELEPYELNQDNEDISLNNDGISVYCSRFNNPPKKPTVSISTPNPKLIKRFEQENKSYIYSQIGKELYTVDLEGLRPNLVRIILDTIKGH